ncbi:MAG: orotate phosphoribosyltransferase [Bacteroidetes bacterium]|nr:MAG: orotate phosphoribosyltransferase [Bacteroidota bacterium]
MIYDEQTAGIIAEQLLQIKAIVLNVEQPFTWASGWKSPIYCDNRKTLSYPVVRTTIKNAFARLIRNNYSQADSIVGVATGGIAHGALAADKLNLPFAYVRSQSKKHGLGNLIEGEIKPGSRVVVLEDLVSTGKSSLQAVDALRENGAQVVGMVAVFSYDFDVARQNFEEKDCPLYTLSDYHHLIKMALTKKYISQNRMQTLQQWRENPAEWGKTLQQ